MGDVVGALNLAPPMHLVQRTLHRAGDAIGIEDGATIDVPCGTPAGLDDRAVTPQEPFLVGVENGDQRHLGQVETFAEQIDADQHVELAEAEPTEDLDTFDRVDVAVQVAHPHAGLLQVIRQVFGHSLGQRGHQHALADSLALPNLAEKIVDLSTHRANVDLGVDQSGGANQLLDNDPFAHLQLEIPRRGRDVHQLR